MKGVYEIGYRYFRMPYDIGPAQELVKFVENGRIPPGRAIDLGCGTGRNALFLAQHSFEVTGVDYASSRILAVCSSSPAGSGRSGGGNGFSALTTRRDVTKTRWLKSKTSAT